MKNRFFALLLVILTSFSITSPTWAGSREGLSDRTRYRRLVIASTESNTLEERIRRTIEILEEDGNPLDRVGKQLPPDLVARVSGNASTSFRERPPLPSQLPVPVRSDFLPPQTSAPAVSRTPATLVVPEKRSYLTPGLERTIQRMSDRRHRCLQEAKRLGIILPSQKSQSLADEILSLHQEEDGNAHPSPVPEPTFSSPKKILPPHAHEKSVPAITSAVTSPAATVSRRTSQDTPGKTQRLTLQVGGFSSDLGGNLTSKEMSLDLAADSDLSRKTALHAAAAYRLSRRTSIHGSFTPLQHSGKLQRTVTFDKNAYLPGASIRLDNHHSDIGLSHSLSSSDRGRWSVLAGAQFFRNEFEMVQPIIGGNRVGQVQQDFSIPYVGISGESRLSKNVGVDGFVKGFSAGGSGDRVRFHDVQGRVLFGPDYRQNPSSTEIHAFAGFRAWNVSGSADGDQGDLRYSGPIFGAQAVF